jgi:hypothetical protein
MKHKPLIKKPEENLRQYFAPEKREQFVTRGELLHMLDLFTKAQRQASFAGRLRARWQRLTRPVFVVLEYALGGALDWATRPFRERSAT